MNKTVTKNGAESSQGINSIGTFMRSPVEGITHMI